MSERGSFVTEFIYCPKCLESIKPILIDDNKYLDSTIVKERPIIAGKIGGLYTGEELHTFKFDLIPRLEKVICHKLRIAVLSDTGGSKIFTALPQKHPHKPTV